jgi:hypothetical protein
MTKIALMLTLAFVSAAAKPEASPAVLLDAISSVATNASILPNNRKHG